MYKLQDTDDHDIGAQILVADRLRDTRLTRCILASLLTHPPIRKMTLKVQFTTKMRNP